MLSKIRSCWRGLGVSLIPLWLLMSLNVQAAPELQAVALSQAPVLDGAVQGDPSWQGLTPATGFTQTRPNEGEPASQRTEVFVGYTDDALYIGVICHDDNPQGIVQADSRRDSSMSDTDSFQIVLDVFRDRLNGLVFGTTPSSVEYDGQVTNEGAGSFQSGGAFNLNWDTTWSVKSKLGDYGWSAEFEIPFKSLRYGKSGVQLWGINFQRNIRRNNEVVYWSAIPRQYNLFRVSRAGTLQGLNLPAQRSFRFTPYLLGQARRGGELPDGTHFEEEVGFDAKYAITPSLTLDLTYNTDFAQVEADEIQVNLDRFNLFFPEKRPFFLENAGQFAVGTPREVELFFSRRIGVGDDGVQQPIDGGVRLSGKIGQTTNVGLLHMRTEGVSGLAPQNDFTVARVNQELPGKSTIGAIFVQRDGDGSISGDRDTDYNRTYAMDGRWQINDDLDIRGFAAKSETPGRRGQDTAYNITQSFNNEQWSQNLGYTKVGENFNPEVGFLQRSNYEKGSFFALRRIRPPDLMGLHEIRPHIAFRGFWDDTGFWESGFTHIDSHWEWRNGLEIHTGVNLLHEGVRTRFEINEGTFVEPGEYDDHETDLVFQTDQGKALSFETRWRHGGFFGGDRDQVISAMKFRFGEKFSSALNWSYNDIELPVANGAFTVNVGRLRLSYSFTPKVLLQALIQYDDRSDLVATNLRFSWLQSANAGLYLVYNEVDDDTVRGPIEKRREFTLKYSRIFNLL